jgi:hypothetical protein
MDDFTHTLVRLTGSVIVTLLFWPGAAMGQGLAKGVRGGVNLTTTATSGEEDGRSLDWQLRPVVGVFVTWHALSWIDLQPELLYAMKGAKGQEFDIPSRLLLDYLEIPVLARKLLGSPHAMAWYVVGGPSFGYRMRAKTRADFGDAIEEIDVSDDVERFDLGVAVGGGMEFRRVVVDARYTHGLTDIDKDTSDDVKVANRAVSVTVGFKF